MNRKVQDVHPANSSLLAESGLNMQAVFELADLPPELLAAIEGVETIADYHQLLVFGHGGRRMWQALSASTNLDVEHPIDCFSADVLARFFSEENPEIRYTLLFPRFDPQGSGIVALQQLGRIAGWHHDSPLRIGVNARWGSWFAYRAVVLADTAFAPTSPMVDASPCASCLNKPCISACPVATAEGDIPLAACMDERLKTDSRCANSCLARLACPVMAEERYTEEQIAYHYDRSLKTIRDYREKS